MKKLIILLLSLGIVFLVCLIFYFVFLWTQLPSTHADKDLKTPQTSTSSLPTSTTQATPTHSSQTSTISSKEESPSIISSNHIPKTESLNQKTKQARPANSSSIQHQMQKRDQTMKQLFTLTEKTSKGETIDKRALLNNARQFITFVKQGVVTPTEAKNTIEFLITVYPNHQKELAHILEQITDE